MAKMYIAEFPGLALQDQGDTVAMLKMPPMVDYRIDPASTTGAVKVLGAITAGTLYTSGTYLNVPLTGGTGSGATANITVSGGGVTAVTIVNIGTGYTAADSLSAAAANIGGTGSGFAVAVTSIIAISAPFNALTRFVLISPDSSALNVAVGPNPVALVSNVRVDIYQDWIFRVNPGDRISCIVSDVP